MRKLLPLFLLLPVSALAADRRHTVTQKGPRLSSRRGRPSTTGEALTFTNDDSFIHQIYVDGLFDSEEKAPGENLNETFPQAGTFQVRCHIHPTMRMTVHVK